MFLFFLACTGLSVGPKGDDTSPHSGGADTALDSRGPIDTAPWFETGAPEDSGADTSDDTGDSAEPAPFDSFPASLTAADAQAVQLGVEGCLAGAALATGDVDGDGEDDVLLGGPWTGGSQGAAALLQGPFASGSLAEAPLVVVGSGAYAMTAYAGFAVGLVDLDGDGLDDVAMGEPGGGYYGGDGAIQVLSGLSAGAPTAFDATIDGETDYDALGFSIASADLDGDGVEELISGAPYYPWGAMDGAVYTIPAGASGTVEVADVAQVRLTASGDGGMAGRELAVGDLDGDGLDDLAIGAAYHDAWTGGVYLAVDVPLGERDLADSVWLEGVGDGAGDALAIGDLDGDGRDDLAIGAAGTATTIADGAIYLFSSPTGVNGVVTDADAVLVGGAAEGLGGALRAVDLDGDGLDELLAGGPTDTLDEDTDSHAWILRPRLAGTQDRADVTLTSVAGSAPGDLTGYALGAADVSGDGAIDLLIAAPKDETAGEDAGALYLFHGAP